MSEAKLTTAHGRWGAVTYLLEPIPEALEKEANRCNPIKGRVPKGLKVAIRSASGDIVGFLCPHLGTKGWRLGPIYVTPEARGAGLTKTAVLRFRALGLVHYVPDTAPESMKMHLNAGFTVIRAMKRGAWLTLPEKS